MGAFIAASSARWRRERRIWLGLDPKYVADAYSQLISLNDGSHKAGKAP